MKILSFTKSKIYGAGRILTVDGIFVYAKDSFLGMTRADIKKLVVVGFVSKKDFRGQTMEFPVTDVIAIGPDERYEIRESTKWGRIRNALVFSMAIFQKRKSLADIDIVFAPYFEYSGFMLLAAKLANPHMKIINYVITDYPLWNFSKRHSYLQKWYLLWHQRFTYLLSDEVWFVSRYLFEKYPTRKGAVIYNSSVRNGQIGFPKKLLRGKISLLFTGRLAEEKNPDVPLFILEMLKKRGHEIVLSYIGDGPLRMALEELAHSLGIEKETRFLGRIFDRDKVFEIFREHDFFVFPSLPGEALGFVVLEAMSQGLVVVGTSAGGVSEVIENGKEGFLLPPETAYDKKKLAGLMTDRIEASIKDPGLYNAMSRRAVEKVARFTIEECGKVQRQHIFELLKK